MRKESKVAKKVVPKQTLATTTPLVKDMFDAMFGGQIDDKALKEIKKRRCGICEVGAYHLFLQGMELRDLKTMDMFVDTLFCGLSDSIFRRKNVDFLIFCSDIPTSFNVKPIKMISQYHGWQFSLLPCQAVWCL